MTLQLMKALLHERYLNYRCISRIINSDLFEGLFSYFTETDIKTINEYIEKCEKDKLEKFIKRKSKEKSELEDLPVILLREKARDLGIKGWQYLNKSILLSEIYSVRPYESIT